MGNLVLSNELIIQIGQCTLETAEHFTVASLHYQRTW